MLLPSTLKAVVADYYAINDEGRVSTEEAIYLTVEKDRYLALVKSAIQELFMGSKETKRRKLHGFSIQQLQDIQSQMMGDAYRSWIISPNSETVEYTANFHFQLNSEINCGTTEPMICRIESPSFEISGIDSYFSAASIELDSDYEAVEMVCMEFHALFARSVEAIQRQNSKLELDVPESSSDTEVNSTRHSHNFSIKFTLPSKSDESKQEPRVSLTNWNGNLDGACQRTIIESYLKSVDNNVCKQV